MNRIAPSGPTQRAVPVFSRVCNIRNEVKGEIIHTRGHIIKQRRDLLWLLSFLALCLLLSGCEGDEMYEEDSRRTLGRCADRVLNVGFYADFVPLSYSQDNQAPTNSEPYNTQRGYEADLLTALEALAGASLAFSRRGIAPVETPAGRTFPFGGIWLLAAEPGYDLISGGITIRDDRTRNAAGERTVAFTSGHVAFRQSLLVRAANVQRISEHGDLTEDDVVSVHRGTTGEERFLQLVGIVDYRGVLVNGTQVITETETFTADGSPANGITAAMSSPRLAARQRLIPPAPLPQVVIHISEDQQMEALAEGEVTAVARGEIGNSDAAAESAGALVVTALDPQSEYGGFAVDVQAVDLLACLNEAIDLLTDDLRIGYREWAANPMVFLERAEVLNAGLPR